MELVLLMKVGMVIDVAVKVGYGIVACYLGATGVRYFKDYKNNVEEEKYLKQK